MKKRLSLLSIFSTLLFACGDDTSTQKQYPPLPKVNAGTVVIADSILIEDDLNVQYYSVKVIATDSSNKGYYIVRAAYGYNIGEGMLAMPDLHEPLKPAMIKNPDLLYSYIIGFTKASEDYKIFHDYFEVKSDRESNLMRYIKNYYFEKVKK